MNEIILKINSTVLEIPKDFTGIVECLNGSKFWCLNGKLHRENDLPACEYANGSKEWWFNGKRHRTDGPAIHYIDGYVDWYLNGKAFSPWKWKELIRKRKHNPNDIFF